VAIITINKATPTKKSLEDAKLMVEVKLLAQESRNSYATRMMAKNLQRKGYRAVDSDGNTLDWMLSANRDKKAEERFFKKLWCNQHYRKPQVINVDHATYIPRTKSILFIINPSEFCSFN
jgi:DDE domain